MRKVRYEFDPHNKLVAAEPGLQGIRQVLDGQFRIADHNTLTYDIKAPIPCVKKSPHQIKLEGIWSLTQDHRLCLTLDKWYRQTFGDQLTIQGEVAGVEKNSLLFAATSRTKEDKPSTYILELTGVWQADTRNRLTFRANKQQGDYDTLTFNGKWEIGKNYQIIYLYQREDLVRQCKRLDVLVFEGAWEIKDKARLSYAIDKKSGSEFNFKTGLGIFKEDYIKYEVGIGLSHGSEAVKRLIHLIGKWKIKKGLGLVFEVRRGDRKVQEIVFGAEARITGKDKVSFNLRNSLNNRAIGAELELSHDIFQGDGRVFLRLLQSGQGAALMLGAGMRW